MGLSKVWVFAESDGDKVKTISLEMLAKARELGDAVECVYAGVAAAVAETLGKQGLQPTGGTPAQLGQTTRMDLERWSVVVRDAKIQPD